MDIGSGVGAGAVAIGVGVVETGSAAETVTESVGSKTEACSILRSPEPTNNRISIRFMAIARMRLNRCEVCFINHLPLGVIPLVSVHLFCCV